MDELIAATLGLIITLTGKFAIRVLTFRRWRCESLDGEKGRIHGMAGALSFMRDDRRVVTRTGQLFAGIGFYIVVIATLLGLSLA